MKTIKIEINIETWSDISGCIQERKYIFTEKGKIEELKNDVGIIGDILKDSVKNYLQKKKYLKRLG